jgi:hypothetical protein
LIHERGVPAAAFSVQNGWKPHRAAARRRSPSRFTIMRIVSVGGTL